MGVQRARMLPMPTSTTTLGINSDSCGPIWNHMGSHGLQMDSLGHLNAPGFFRTNLKSCEFSFVSGTRSKAEIHFCLAKWSGSR